MAKLTFWKKAKIENDLDLANTVVVLPTSKVEVTLEKLINDADIGYAHPDHRVKMHDGSEMKVGDLLAKHKQMCDEMEAMKAKKEDASEDQDKEYEEAGEPKHDAGEEEKDLKVKEEKVEVEGDDKAKDNDEAMGDKEAKEKAMALAEHEEKEIEAAKKKNAKEKADRLRNAGPKAAEPVYVELSEDRVARGKARYGSN